MGFMGNVATGAELFFFHHRRQIKPESISGKIRVLPSDSHKDKQVGEINQLMMKIFKRMLQPSFQVKWKIRENGNALFPSCFLDAVSPISLLHAVIFEDMACGPGRGSRHTIGGDW